MQAGDVIQDRYELEDRLGRGGMGQVWRARDVRLERTVALKLISPGLAEEPEFLVRFLREAQSIARINHPNVVNILDFGETNGSPFLVMEHVPGQSLAEVTGEPLDEDRAREILAQAAAGAGAAHAQNIIHRDIKPANILVTDDGRAKLVDFGIASAIGSERLTVTGTTIGSPHYISPEQASGERATPESDVYSLGIVLFELLSGRKPFEADNVAAIAAAHIEQPAPPLPNHVDEGLAAIVARCLSKEPSERFDDGAALADALRSNAPAGTAVMAAASAAAAGGDTAVLSTSAWEDDAPPETSDSVGKAILTGLLIGLVLLAIFVGVLMLVRGGDDTADANLDRDPGGGPGPSQTTESPEVEEPAEAPVEVPEEEPPPEEPPPEDDTPAEEPPGEGEEDDTGEDPGSGEQEEPSDEATIESEVEPVDPGNGGGGGNVGGGGGND